MEKKYTLPKKEYSIAKTTKVQREKIAIEALGLSTLDAPEPSAATMKLVQEYVNGKAEIETVLEKTIARYNKQAI